MIGKANSLFDDGGDRQLLAKDLLGHFGIGRGSVSQRSEPMLGALGINPCQYGAMNLGSPRYLTSSRRARILVLRDHYRAVGAETP